MTIAMAVALQLYLSTSQPNINMKKNFIISAFAFCGLCVQSMDLMSQEVVRVSPDESNGFGIVYHLPQTALSVTVVATCTEVKKGQFADYAERYLGTKDAPKEDATRWDITDVSLTAFALPDTSRRYKILLDGNVPISFYLTDAGILSSINREPAVSDPASHAPLSASATTEEKQPIEVHVMNEELMKAGSEAKQAEIAARQIFRIRQARLNLITGEVDNLPADGASFQLVLDNLEAQEQAYLALFTGTKEVRTVTRHFTFVADQATEGETLFRFSRHYGFADIDDLGGVPFRITMQISEDNRLPKEPAQTDASDEKKRKFSMGGKSRDKEQGLAYALPGKASVTCQFDGKQVAALSCRMGQLGRVEYLPVSKFQNKKQLVSAEFDPLTGAVTLYDQK